MARTTAAKDLPKFVVRLPEDLKAWLQGEARRNRSSQNSEVVRAVRDRMDRQRAPQTMEG